jgi:phosphonate transport system substrate-binding protein
MNSIDRLHLVSYLAPNLFWFYRAIEHYLQRVLHLDTHLEQSKFDPLADPVLQQDQLDLAFICGLPFARYNRSVPGQLNALVAPVMQATRYQDRAIYFADVIVRAGSPFITWNDLAGTRFCYNDPGSNSGYNLVRQRLMQGKYPPQFFGRAIASGSHQQSIRWVRDGTADCAAIDSTVLEQELRDVPELADQLRVVKSLGPCPMPPIAVSQRLGNALIDQIQTALLHPDGVLRSAMDRAAIQRFVAVESEQYAAIAVQYDQAVQAGYERLG